MHQAKDNSGEDKAALIERAEEILCDALEIASEADRKAFVKDACAEDPDLSSLVDHMLQVQGDSERLLSAIHPTSFSVMEMTRTVLNEISADKVDDASLPDDDEVGKQIGNYKLLKKIGEGGGGNVYLAEQEKPVRRQVALKIIKLGMDTKSVIARFEAERQTLAMMEHPNIAHVLNAGTTDTGRPYFVMELVDGTPVTAYCENVGMGIHDRLKLFIQICQAIHHAHQKGIIHRDIKPSNILVVQVDGVTAPKIIDFGIAKATGEQMLNGGTFFTSMEHFVGTPAYMSPEQADHAVKDIDVRSDIYSLGVLLYELLTGKTPFDQKKLIRSGLEKMRHTIRECEPPRPSVMLAGMLPEEIAVIAESRRIPPSRLLSHLVGDLDWIVMKALEKERELRYGSAEGMADDVRHYLEHEPVTARPPSRTYRLRKLVRRNKATFVSGAIVAAVLMISTGVSTWLLIEQRLAENRARRAEAERGTIQKEADALRANVESQAKMAKAMVLFRRDQLEQADAILQGVENVPISPGNASMFRGIGDWHALNGRWDRAKVCFDALIRIDEFEGLNSTMDDGRYAALLVEQGHWAEYDAFREALSWRYIGTESPEIARRVLRACLLAPSSKELLDALAPYVAITERWFNQGSADISLKGWAAYSMVLWAYRKGDYEKCLQWCERVLPGLDNDALSVRTISVHFLHDAALYQLGRVDEAKACLDKARLDMEKLSAAKPSDSNVWRGYWFDRAYMRLHLREAVSLIGSEAGRE